MTTAEHPAPVPGREVVAQLLRRAARLDADDPLAHLRERFVPAEHLVSYLDGNSLGRPLRVTGPRLAQFVEGAWGTRLIRSWGEGWMQQPTALGDRLAAVALGAGPGTTVVADSTTVLLYKLLRAALTRDPARTEIVCDTDNFPTDRFVVQGVAAECGVTVRWVRPAAGTGVTGADLAPVLGPATAVVLLSHVAYRTGYLADLPGITAQVHRAGALVLWDLCHSAGVVDLALDADAVDLAVGCTYKYLNGGPGAPAFAYVAPRLQETLHQPVQGWMGAADPFAMGPTYVPAPGVRRFVSGTPPIVGMLPLHDMLDLLAEVGVPAVRAKSVRLTGFALEVGDALLAPLGAVVSSPRRAELRGGHVTFDHPRFEQVVARLWARGVVPDFRPPHGLRVGLSPTSTSFTEVVHGLDAAAQELHATGAGADADVAVPPRARPVDPPV